MVAGKEEERRRMIKRKLNEEETLKFYREYHQFAKEMKERENRMDKVYQSAKVYVLDFHFESKDKEAIGKMKKELTNYFLGLKEYLDNKYDRTVIRQIFLRVH